MIRALLLALLVLFVMTLTGCSAASTDPGEPAEIDCGADQITLRSVPPLTPYVRETLEGCSEVGSVWCCPSVSVGAQ